MKIKTYLFGLLVVAFVAVACDAQSRTNRLYRPCSGSSTPATVEVQRDGDINLVPCSGRQIQINGTEFSSAFTVSGAARTSFFPYFSTETNLAKSPFSWNGTTYSWNNTAANSVFTMGLSTDTGSGGSFMAGKASGTRLFIDGQQGETYLDSEILIQLTSGQAMALSAPIGITINSAGSNTKIGDTGLIENGTVFTVNDLNETYTFGNSSADTTFQGPVIMQTTADMVGIATGKTNTPGGITGNVTIDLWSGTVNFAAGAGAAGLTVTNARTVATSNVAAFARTNDASCTVKNVVPASGSFVIRMTANCTAETSVGFLVLN